MKRDLDDYVMGAFAVIALILFVAFMVACVVMTWKLALS